MKTRKSVLAASFGILATLVVTAAVAWACTKSGYVAVSPGSAPAGSVVSVSGGEFRSSNVDIRWGGERGVLLAVAQGPSFSVKVTIPADAAPDVYYISLVQQGYAYASSAFTVTTGSPTSDTGADTSSSKDGSKAGTSSGSTSSAGTAEGTGTGYSLAPTGGAGSDDSASPTAGTSPGSADTSAQPATAGEPQPARSAQASAPASAAGATPSSPGNAAVTRSSPGNAAGSEGLTASGKPLSASGSAVADAPPAVEQQEAASGLPSGRTVSGDVWGGFATGLTPSYSEPGLGVANQGGSAGNAQSIAIGLLAVGTVGLMAGFALTMGTRRRQVANASRIPPAA